MKAEVWTSWDVDAADHDSGKPKCIFKGEISAVPREGEFITLRDGFGAEVVRSVTYDFVSGDVEISVLGIDRNNEYGHCMRESLDD